LDVGVGKFFGDASCGERGGIVDGACDFEFGNGSGYVGGCLEIVGLDDGWHGGIGGFYCHEVGVFEVYDVWEDEIGLLLSGWQ